MDLRYTRFIPIRGSVRAEIIAELKNVFNTEQMSGINTVVDDRRGRQPDDADSDRPVSVPERVRLRAAQVPARVQGPLLDFARSGQWLDGLMGSRPLEHGRRRCADLPGLPGPSSLSPAQ